MTNVAEGFSLIDVHDEPDEDVIRVGCVHEGRVADGAGARHDGAAEGDAYGGRASDGAASAGDAACGGQGLDEDDRLGGPMPFAQKATIVLGACAVVAMVLYCVLA